MRQIKAFPIQKFKEEKGVPDFLWPSISSLFNEITSHYNEQINELIKELDEKENEIFEKGKESRNSQLADLAQSLNEVVNGLHYFMGTKPD